VAEERTHAVAALNPVGLSIVAVGLVGSAVGFAHFAAAAKGPLADWHQAFYALLCALGGIVLVEVGSWLSAPFYRSLEKSEARGWIENTGAVALVLGVVLFGNFLALYGLGMAEGCVAGMAIGLALIELALAAEHRAVIRMCTSPSFPVTMIVVAAGVLGVVALALISYINYRHYRRVDLTEKGIYTLDPRTVNIIKGLKGPLRLISTMVQNPNPRMEMEQFKNVVRNRANDMLEEYKTHSRFVEFIPLNPYSDPDARDKLQKELKTEILRDSVIFAYEGKTKVIEFNELISQSPDPREGPAFKGEEVFTSALQSLIEGKATKVYFVKGHGERDTDDYDREGVSALAEQIRGDNCEVKTIELPDIPTDCDVLIIAGPKRPFLPAELDALRSYLTDRKKGLVVLLDPAIGDVQPSGLEPLLKGEGIDVRSNETLIEMTQFDLGGFIGQEPSASISTTDYGADRATMMGGPPHPIIRDMKNIRTAYYMACPVSALMKGGPRGPYGPQGDPSTTELVKTSPRAFAKADYDPSAGAPARPDPERDKQGPFAIAVAHGSPQEEQPMPMPMMRPPGGRLVVFGDSDFVSNMLLERGAFGNSMLFRNTLAWVAGKEYKIGIPAKPLRQEHLLDMTEEQKVRARWATVFLPPFTLLVLGFVVWWIRRR